MAVHATLTFEAEESHTHVGDMRDHERFPQVYATLASLGASFTLVGASPAELLKVLEPVVHDLKEMEVKDLAKEAKPVSGPTCDVCGKEIRYRLESPYTVALGDGRVITGHYSCVVKSDVA